MPSIVEFLNRLGSVRLMALAGVAVAMIAFFVFFTTRMTHQDMGVLFSDVAPADAGGIVSRLEAEAVEYEIGADGTTILVPRKDAARLRMLLAEAGLPSGGGVGYEIFDESAGLGVTSFTQNINQLRALEGELSRSIRTLAPVKAARVHLVMPKREVFSRDTQEPTASIIISMVGVAQLTPTQIAAIQHLVASAVPKLSPSRVSIIDARGNLLASGGDEDADPTIAQASKNAAVREAYESRVAHSIEEMLERSIGYGKVRAEVTAEMDFDREEISAETYDPDGQVLRSTQTVTEENVSEDKAGTDSNVSVDNNLPPDNASDAPGSSSRKNRVEEVNNFEISKTVRTHVRESGAISRLSVAVMVDGTYSSNDDGETVYEERTPEELAKLNTLVRSAVGFNAERGDRVEIVNLRFARPNEEPDVELNASFLQLDKSDYFRMAEMAVLAIVALLVMLLVIRPTVARIIEASKPVSPTNDGTLLQGGGAPLIGADGHFLEQQGAAGDVRLSVEDQQMIDVQSVEGRMRESSLKRIGELINEHPQESVNVVRNWLYQPS